MTSATLPSEPEASRPQRAHGLVKVAFGARGLEVLRQQGCGRCLMPDTFGGDPLAVIVNTAGGLTGGDRFDVAARAGSGSGFTLTTQAAERIYRSAGDRAEIVNSMLLGPGASLNWIPQETILFERAAMARRLEVEMAPDARFLGLEMLVLGRRSMGETLTRAAIRDDWRIRRGGRLIHAEALRLEGDIAALSGRAALVGGARAIATLVVVAPEAEAMLDVARGLLPGEGLRAAASAWEGRLVVRWLAHDLMPLKSALKKFLAGFPGVSIPRVWQNWEER